ncbi:MAG TPA: GNAT family N-acetyltransferase [Gemmatimonadaceae bacterium]
MHTTHLEYSAGPSPNADVTVRTASGDHLDTVVALRLALLREYDGHPIYGTLHPDAETRARQLCVSQMDSPRDVFLLAEVDGNAVGLMRCTDTQASPLLWPERFAYVSSVYVQPRFRRRGVLRALLASAEAWCVARGLAEMRLHNVPGDAAASAWDALGFGMVEQVRTHEIRSH